MQVEKDPTPLAHGRPRHFRAEHLARISTPGDREGYPPATPPPMTGWWSTMSTTVPAGTLTSLVMLRLSDSAAILRSIHARLL